MKKELTTFRAALYFTGQSQPVYRSVSAFSKESAHGVAQRGLSLKESEHLEKIVIDEPGFENIQPSGFESTEERHETQSVTVSNRISAKIALSPASVSILLHGAMLITDGITPEMLKIVAQIGIGPVSEMTREQVMILRRLLETRIAHCEMERDQRSEKFNADTYITMKMLLLDIREWLLGEII